MSDSSPLAFYVVDNRSDEILYFNSQFCEMWGIEYIAERMRSGELKNCDIIADCLPVLIDVSAFAASSKSPHDEENRITIDDEIAFTGDRTICRFSTQIRDDDDVYFGRFYIFEDISARKQAEAAAVDGKSEQTEGPGLMAEFTALESPHLLFIDDDQSVLKLFEQLLEHRGYRFSGFTDPVVAMNTVRAHPFEFDAVVTDYNMPAMAGLEVARTLHQIRPDLPLAVASGFVDEDLREGAHAAGVQCVIAKPFTSAQLYEMLERMLPGHLPQLR